MILNAKPNKIEYGFYFILLAILIISLSTSLTNQDYFNSNLAAEDGVIEWVSALLLFFSCILLVLRLIRLWKYKSFTWTLGMTVLSILFLFGAGEEISWGQRLFDIKSNTYFIEHNLQKETNIHNLTINGVSINKFVFSKLIFLVLIIYLLILPLMYLKFNWVKSMCDRFAIPIIKMHHVIAFVLSTLVVLSISANRKWEVYEFCFGFIFLMIFYNPLNYWIYKTKEE